MSASDNRSTARRGAFFGRRKGHALRPRQAGLIDALLPHLSIDLTTRPPTELRDLFSSASQDVRLEIGFGGGEHLIGEAKANLHSGFIGIEPFLNGMAKALALIEDNHIVNIRLHFGDAVDVFDWLPASSLACVDLIYPDPWPKRRHWKRRFVQDRSIAEIARILKPGGEFRFVTDIPDYAAWTLERLLRSRSFTWIAERADDWRQPWKGFTSTRYEAKAKRAGRVPCYLVFRRAD